MKKLIKKTVNSVRNAAIRLAATRRSGEGYIDTAVKILIAVVLGALLLAGLYALFGDVVMPTLNQRIKDKLIERFPFLIPRNRWTGKVPEDYDYSYTELDSMPDGWRKAFGEQMCEDIREELVRAEYLDQYRITQIKEKYGTLCWYDFGCTERMLRDIIPKYEHLSARTCIRCGNPATKVSTGWISPYCDTCAGKISHAERFISIEEWLDRSSSEVTSKRSLNEKDTHSL